MLSMKGEDFMLSEKSIEINRKADITASNEDVEETTSDAKKRKAKEDAGGGF
jgi:hypothetical protein